MARRRRRRLGRATLAFGGAIAVAIIIMVAFFPNIVSLILPADADSGTWTFAFPDIDTIQKFPQATVLTPAGYFIIPESVLQCDFKFTVQAINDRGQIVEQRQSGLSDPRAIFTTADITTRFTTGTPTTDPTKEFSTAGLSIDHYDITPLMKCTKRTGDLSFGSGVKVLPSIITLDTFVTKPDGSTVKLSQKRFTVQSTGAGGTTNYLESLFFGIPNIFTDQTGILDNGAEIKFKGTGGALTADKKFRVTATEIDNVLPAQIDIYNSEIRYQMTGTLNIDYIFNKQNTQIFKLDPSNLQKILFIRVDKRSEVPPTDPQIPQTIDITRAVTAGGKVIVGLNAQPLNPDGGTNERSITVSAFLDGYVGTVETLPRVTLKHLSGSQVSGVNIITMFDRGADVFQNPSPLVIPNSIQDGNYLLHVSNSRQNIGLASIVIQTPQSTVTQPKTCPQGEIDDGNGNCIKDPTNGGTNPVPTSCDSGFRLVGEQCIAILCSDGFTPIVNGCPVEANVCQGDEIDNGDGTCTEPNCGVGLKFNPNSLTCELIRCQSGFEYDTITLQCIQTSVVCGTGEVLNSDKTGCVPAGDVTTVGGDGDGDGEVEKNILNIRQELRYTLVTTDQSGLRTPVESGVIPPDESLFAGLTPLQFLVETKTNPLTVKFDVLEVDSFLIVPPTVSSPQISNVNLNQNLFFYHKNIIGSTGIPSTNTPALTVNLPMGTLAEIKTASGSGFFALGKMEITTSDILSAVAPSVQLKEGEIISVMYVIDGDFDLTTDGGTKEFDGVIKQMRYWKNLIYTDKDLNGDECIGKSGRDLLKCQFDTTGNNSLEGLCPTIEFQACLDSLDDRTIDLVINKACEDTEGFEALIDILNVESGFTEEFGGTGVKSTEDILRDLQLASGCDPQTVEMVVDKEFKCASGTFAKQGVTATSQEQCFDQCSEELTGVVGGGQIDIKDRDGTTECRAPSVTTSTGETVCESGSMRDMATNECVFPPSTTPSETTNFINGLLDSFQKFLESFTNSDEKEITGGGGSGGKAEEGGACGGNILNCIVELFGVKEIPTEIIPPELQIAGSSSNTLILIGVIIVALLITSAVIARRRRRKLLG